MKPTSLLLVLFALRAAALHADNWPQWRGPSGTGVSTEKGIPTEWGAGKNIAWKAPLGGLGVSAPIVWGNRAFVTYQIGSSALRAGSHPSLVQGADPVTAGEKPLGGARPSTTGGKIVFAVAAFDTSNGRQVWEYRFDQDGRQPEVHEKRNLATPSPVTDGERVYAWFSDGQLVALDMAGKLVWKRHLARDYQPFDLNWGHSSSPALYRDLLILPCYEDSASNLIAVDKRTGREVWKVAREKGLLSYSTPLVIETAQGPALVLNTSERVEAFDPATGKALWHFVESNRFPIPMPVYHDGLLYLSRGYRSGPYMALRPTGEGDISKSNIVWRVGTGAPYISSIVYQDGLIYMAGDVGIVTCVDAKTGERVWQERLNGIYTASPVAADGKIYLFSETGETLVLRGGRKAEVLAKNNIEERIIASPAVSNGRLYIRTDQSLIAIGGTR